MEEGEGREEGERGEERQNQPCQKSTSKILGLKNSKAFFKFSKSDGRGLRYVAAKKPTLLEKVSENFPTFAEKDFIPWCAVAGEGDPSGAECVAPVCETHSEP